MIELLTVSLFLSFTRFSKQLISDSHDTKRKPQGHQDSGPQPTTPKNVWSVKAQERDQIIPTLSSYMEVP